MEQYAALPKVVTVRELRYRIGRRGFRTHHVTLVTTLVDPEAYPAEAVAELYGTRWRVEQDLQDLMQTIGMDLLKCKTLDGVLKELHAFTIVYNLVRMTIVEAAARQSVPVERISFVDALRWLEAAAGPASLLRLVINPARPGRAEPRVRNRRPKEFPVMKQPRAEWKKTMMAQKLIA